jgi:hypothetical protein
LPVFQLLLLLLLLLLLHSPTQHVPVLNQFALEVVRGDSAVLSAILRQQLNQSVPVIAPPPGEQTALPIIVACY